MGVFDVWKEWEDSKGRDVLSKHQKGPWAFLSCIFLEPCNACIYLEPCACTEENISYSQINSFIPIVACLLFFHTGYHSILLPTFLPLSW